jgi:hypothetical protein
MWTMPVKLRASTVVLFALILILGPIFAVRQRRLARLEAAFTDYQRVYSKDLETRLGRKISLTPPDSMPLREFLELLEKRYRETPLTSGTITTAVDLSGLAQARQSLTSRVEIPAPGGMLSVREHLHLALEPLGLGATVKDGAIVITSRKIIDDQPVAKD